MQSTRKERIGWYFYDFANSAFYTTVITVFLGPYLTTIAKNCADASGFIDVYGINVFSGSYFAYLVSFSVLLQVVFLPILGAIADYSKRKKLLMGVFAYCGAAATSLFYFLGQGNYMLGGWLFVVANFSFGASVVMYNAFLNDIASAENRDEVSSNGWAFGYLGGGIVLAANLFLFSNAESFGLETSHAVRISLCSAGLWWATFTVLPMLTLKNRSSSHSLGRGEKLLTVGFKKLLATVRDARNHPQTIWFLLAYVFFNDGVQSVIALSSQFGQEELGLELSTLTTVILMVQFVAFGGALLFKYISKLVGNKRAILFSLVIWTAAVLFSYQFLSSEFHFYILGFVVAIVLGGTQALSRSLFSQLIPEGAEAEYFSLYEVSERGTSWLGPFVFGLSLQLTNSYRTAILSLIAFFVIGFVLLLRLKTPSASKK